MRTKKCTWQPKNIGEAILFHYTKSYARERGSNNIFIPLYSKRLMVLHNITIDTIQNKATRKKVRE
jgi:hypothetical protein